MSSTSMHEERDDRRVAQTPSSTTGPESVSSLAAHLQSLQVSAGNTAVAATLGQGARPAAGGPRIAAAESGGAEGRADSAAARAGSLTPTPDTRSRLDGAPLSPDHQQQLSSITGGDVSGVRIHTGPDAMARNRELGAHAHTSGTDIHFGAGEYDPGSRAGMSLLAHEVSHAVHDAVPGEAGGVELVHAKLKGTRQALVALGGDKGKGIRKKLLGSKWNDLLSKLASYEKLEASYEAIRRSGGGKKEASAKKGLLKALAKLEATALAWRAANDEQGQEAIEVEYDLTLGGYEDPRSKAERRQAVTLVLQRVRAEATDLRTGRWDSSGFDDSTLAWGKDDAVGGGMNRLDQVAYTSEDGTITEGYFKEDKAFSRDMAGPDELAGIGPKDSNWGGRSVAMYRLDKLLQGGVIARTEFAVHTSRTGTRDKKGNKTGSQEATAKLGFVTEKAQGEEMQRLIETAGVVRTEDERSAGNEVDLEDPTLQRCLNKLQIIDVIAGQLDRHEGNFFVQRDPTTGTVLGVTGIDNDMAFGEKMEDIDWKRAHNYIGMPELVDEQFGNRILQVTEKDIRDTLDGLIARSEIDATVKRFLQVQAMVRSLKDNDQLTRDWNKDTAQHEDREKGQFDEKLPFLGARAGEKVWAVAEARAEAALDAHGMARSDRATVIKELSLRGHRMEVMGHELVDIVEAVAARLEKIKPPTIDAKGQPTLPSFGQATVTKVLSEVLLQRGMSKQLDRMMARR